MKVVDEIGKCSCFDASRFFNFSVQETVTQARQAELWFQAVGSYPPSPFVANLVLREEDVTATTVHDPKPNVFQHYDSKAVSGTGKISGFQGGVFQNVAMQMQPGMTFSSKTNGGGGLNSKDKSAAMKGSTLMKPTPSQLAKQNRPPQIVGSRSAVLILQIMDLCLLMLLLGVRPILILKEF